MYKVSRLLHLVRQNGLQHTVFIENTYPSKKKNDKEAFDNTGFFCFLFLIAYFMSLWQLLHLFYKVFPPCVLRKAQVLTKHRIRTFSMGYWTLSVILKHHWVTEFFFKDYISR